MGQSSSLSVFRKRSLSTRINSKSTAIIAPEESTTTTTTEDEENGLSLAMFTGDRRDYISELPDECLAYVFHSLGSGDRKRCSLVCRRWLVVEGQSRQRLSLDARYDLSSEISSLFTRFDSVTKLVLKCDRKSISIGDEALIMISLCCPNLARMKLRACRELTDAGMLGFAKNCKSLKKLSCVSCTFGSKGMNAVLDNCSLLEELTVKRLRGIADGSPAEPIGPGVAAASLKSICLKELYNGQSFAPLIVGAMNLKTLKLFRCSGDWDELFELIPSRVSNLVEVHLERLQVSDRGLAAISNFLHLEILHLVKTPECTNASLVSIADQCKLLRKLHIDGWKTNRIGDEGLIAIAKHCPKLQELVLISVNPTSLSLGLLGDLQNLERLALCGSETIGDSEISCIATKCMALKKLCIKSCPVTNHTLEALVGGCPKLVKLKVKKCRGVTSDGVGWLRSFRQSVTVNYDVIASENLDASASDGGLPEIPTEVTPVVGQTVDSIDVASSSNGQASLSKARLGSFIARNFAACAFRRWSNVNNSDDT